MICPWCRSEVDRRESFLGVLGNLRHYRCRQCGGMFYRATAPKRQLIAGNLESGRAGFEVFKSTGEPHASD